MRATGMAAFLCLLLVCTTIPFQPNTNNQLAEETVIAQSNSDVTITFTNGPSSSQSLTGVYTLSFSFGGSGTVTSLTIEISDGTTWDNVATLTASPWVTYLDTTTLTNGSYTLKATAYDDTVAENVVEVSPSFTIDNQIPIITQFTVDNIEYGTGSSALDRAWFSIDSTAALEFSWNAVDDDLLRATLTNVPGPGAPASDGPSNIAFGWDWSSGSFDEGTWNPRLTVYDNSGLSVTETMFIGIDRTGPTIGTITSGSSSGWLSSSGVTLSGLINAVDDGQGSGLAYTEISLDGASWTQNTLDSYTLNLNDGSHTISIRAADNVGNIGPTTQISVQVDTEDPIANGWVVDELTTALIGPANVEFLAIDESSGIDNTNSFIEYGFDANGFGQTPDLSGSWQASMGSGLDSVVAQSSWATKSRQYLMLRATVTDIAGNSFQTSPVFYQILPSLDFEWNLTETNVDRLIVKPGDSTGNITVTGLLEVNENYGGTITLRLESAPADRDAQVAWTVIESRTLDAGLMTDREELLIWNYTVPSKGQFDLRLVIDPNNVIDEYNENNNQNYMVVTGASVSSVINAPSFNPSIGAIIVCAFVISLLQRNTRD
ncbi:MAG: hypothetical protein ISP82_03890 [Candidatus Poseidoniaceae archaeon]|nr:hypothetical protein [Candidatus Poseidoniaceae archaeon]MBL6896209.1 hypothetical protein [Candidatus Poseidoniaceae archaeon]MDB4656664.1 hypothetical protein [Candidatus Poseidoniaceae archaeon]